MDIVYKKGVVNHADALSRRPDMKDSLHKLQLLRDWTNDEAECELHAQIFSLESRLHPNSGLHAEIKTLMTRINTCLPRNLCLLGRYVNQMDSCTPTGQDCMCRTSLHCNQDYCTNYTTQRPRDIVVLFNYWQQ
jgi:hypothetical protein